MHHKKNQRRDFRPASARAARPQRSSQKIKFPPGRIIMGRNTLKEVLRCEPKRILRVYTTEAAERDGHTRKDVLGELEKLGIPVEIFSADELTQSVDSDSHQSFIAVLKDTNQQGLKEFIDSSRDKTTSLVLILDSINDPQNLGALLRAAECFGVDAVLFSKNRGTGLTPVVSKASVGASELVNVISISNLADAVGKLKDGGFWIVAADVNETASRMGDFKFPEKTVLIMGSEGQGIQSLLKKSTDFTVEIPLYGKINSLNVSQATSIFLYAYRAQFPQL